jgi:hypothetical protein
MARKLGVSEMNLHSYSALILVVTAVLALFVASPALERVLVYPQAEFFTELSLLGPSNLAQDYPYNITTGENYTVYLAIGNQLGSCAYYQVYVKFRNQTQSAPDSFNRTASSLPSLYNMAAFVADKETLEMPLNFAFDYSFQNVTRTFYSNVTLAQGAGNNDTIEQRADNITLLQANLNSLKINNVTLGLQGFSSDWNPQTGKFYGDLVFELWIYNVAIGGFQYHERFVDLKFNMTSNVMGNIIVG